MTTISDLHRTVEQTIATKRLGTPVFVRYLLHSHDKASVIPTRLACIAEAIRNWLNKQKLDRIYAIGSAASGHMTLTLEFDKGGTAQVSWVSGRGRGEGVDLMVIGNHGAIYHDVGATRLWDQPAPPLKDEPDDSLVQLIKKAIQSGQPESTKK